jgi:ribosomal protein S18 acetylase RimI-like enzyme
MPARPTPRGPHGKAATRELEIVPLTPARLPDLAALFGQGGDPRDCWCAFYRTRERWPAKLEDRIARNRTVLESAVSTLQTEDRAPGLVAYRGGEAVGWVSLGARTDYERLEHSTVLARIDDKPVWSIVCFVVGRKSRGQGVADALLDAAIVYARDHGATLLEAYPTDTDGKRIPAADAYRGTLSMFERAGFEVAARRRFNAASPVHPIVRRRVRKPRSDATAGQGVQTGP